MKNKTKAIILLSILCPLSIWGCLSAAALFYTDAYELRRSKESSCMLESIETIRINPSLTRYKFLSKRESSGVAIIVHGLNVRPLKMFEIVHELTKMDIEVFSLSLKGHGTNYSKSADMQDVDARMNSFKSVSYNIWHEELASAYEVANLQSSEKNVPIYFVGYSIGGLLGVDLLASNSQIHFDKLVLFAPALTVKSYCFQLQILSYFSDFVIPSVSPRNYRANDGTPIAAYNVLFDTISRLNQSNISRTNVPILVFIDKKDEFVSAEALEKFVRKHKLNQWKICYIENQRNSNRVYHHLIIDSQSVGQKTWNSMVSQLKQHINSSLIL